MQGRGLGIKRKLQKALLPPLLGSYTSSHKSVHVLRGSFSQVPLLVPVLHALVPLTVYQDKWKRERRQLVNYFHSQFSGSNPVWLSALFTYKGACYTEETSFCRPLTRKAWSALDLWAVSICWQCPLHLRCCLQSLFSSGSIT